MAVSTYLGLVPKDDPMFSGGPQIISRHESNESTRETLAVDVSIIRSMDMTIIIDRRGTGQPLPASHPFHGGSQIISHRASNESTKSSATNGDGATKTQPISQEVKESTFQPLDEQQIFDQENEHRDPMDIVRLIQALAAKKKDE